MGYGRSMWSVSPKVRKRTTRGKHESTRAQELLLHPSGWRPTVAQVILQQKLVILHVATHLPPKNERVSTHGIPRPRPR